MGKDTRDLYHDRKSLKAGEEMIAKPGLYTKGKRSRICLGQEGFFVYYKTFSRPRETTAVRIDLWEKWAKDAVYSKPGE